MGATAGVVQDVVRANQTGETGADLASTRGASDSRQVSRTPEGAALPALGSGSRPPVGPLGEPAEKALRCRTVRTLSVWSGSAGVAAKVLTEVAGMVSTVEADVREAGDLLQRSRREMLNDTEWRGLSGLISSVRNTLWAFDDKWDDRLQRLQEEEVLRPSDREALRELRGRLAGARRHFNSDELTRESTIRPVQTTLPNGGGTSVVVESRVVPGTALGSRFAGGYPAEQIADPSSSARHRHVVGLEQSILTDANGEVLYSGLRHGYADPRDLTMLRLASLADGELRALLRELCVRDFGWFRRDDPPRESDIDRFFTEIREGHWAAELQGAAIKHAARCKMTNEIATAALVADPAKLQRAIGGETVGLQLGMVWLAMQHDADLLKDQRYSFDSLAGPAVPLKVNDADGEPRTVLATVGVSQFSLGHEDGFLFSNGDSVLALRELVGMNSTRELRGAAAAGVRDIRARVAHMREDIARLAAQNLRTTQQFGVEPTRGLPLGKRPSRAMDELSGLGRAIRRLELNACTLEDAGKQVKSVWIDTEDAPVSDEVCKQVAARLVLITYLLGWTPAPLYRSELPYTLDVDAEVKFLATVASCNNGHLPPVDRDESVWGRARCDFGPR